MKKKEKNYGNYQSSSRFGKGEPWRSVGFKCNCSKERLTKALVSLGKKEIKSILDDGKPITMNCHFCNTDYTFEIDELREIYNKIK